MICRYDENDAPIKVLKNIIKNTRKEKINERKVLLVDFWELLNQYSSLIDKEKYNGFIPNQTDVYQCGVCFKLGHVYLFDGDKQVDDLVVEHYDISSDGVVSKIPKLFDFIDLFNYSAIRCLGTAEEYKENLLKRQKDALCHFPIGNLFQTNEFDFCCGCYCADGVFAVKEIKIDYSENKIKIVCDLKALCNGSLSVDPYYIRKDLNYELTHDEKDFLLGKWGIMCPKQISSQKEQELIEIWKSWVGYDTYYKPSYNGQMRK